MRFAGNAERWVTTVKPACVWNVRAGSEHQHLILPGTCVLFFGVTPLCQAGAVWGGDTGLRRLGKG